LTVFKNFHYRLGIPISVLELAYTMFVLIPIGFPWKMRNGNSNFWRRLQVRTKITSPMYTEGDKNCAILLWNFYQKSVSFL